MLVLFGLPDALHPAYLSAFNAALPDVRRVANRSEAEILICSNHRATFGMSSTSWVPWGDGGLR
eukprot:14412123-Alexandrium_andersonii.AAC.1